MFGYFFLGGLMNRLIPVLLITLLLFSSAISAPIDFFADSIPRLLSNSGVDVVWDGTYVWIGTSKGLSGVEGPIPAESPQWRSYDSTNGLLSDEISALASGNGELWVANSSFIISNAQSIPVGEGFAMTADFGNSFQTFTPFQASSPGMICYDMDVFNDSVYAACFYGGLIYSEDGGQTWENLYADTLARQDFLDSNFNDLNNRYFTVQVDDNYFDTLVIWGGTAAGINQFQFIGRSAKLAGNQIVDLARMNSFDAGDDVDSNFVWIATNLGLSRSSNSGRSFRSFFESDGLTGEYISAVAGRDETVDFPAYVICAGYFPDADSANGFAWSDDNGQSWNQVFSSDAVGSGKMITDIIIVSDSIIYAACSEGGLIRSMNLGQTWDKIVLDDQNTSPDDPTNQIFSLTARFNPPFTVSDSMVIYAGSGDGYWQIYLTENVIDSINYNSLDDIEFAGPKVIDMKFATWVDSETEEDRSELGLVTVASQGMGFNSILLTQDEGQTWTETFVGDMSNQMIYTDSVIWLASSVGLQRYSRSNDAWSEISLGDPVKDIQLDTNVTTVLFDDIDTLFWAGTANGIANSPNALPNLWDIDTVNLDPEKFDHNIRATSGENGLSGNFAVAIETQYYNGQRYIWAAANSTGIQGEENGINLSTDNGQTWEEVITGLNCWNFSFDDGDVYAATSAGLLRTSDFGESWDTLEIVDAARGTEIYPGTEFFGVATIEDVIWAASDDGIGYSTNQGSTWSIERTFAAIPDEAEAEVYASPLPSSPFQTPGGRVRFHYMLSNEGNVTIKVFDFAMNLVATPVDGEPREANRQYDSDSWDMRNDNGDVVATGPYYFKVENSSGEEMWGKILVIP